MQVSLQEPVLQHPRNDLNAMANKTPDVIIIRGAPGSGKSSAAKCLARHFPEGVRMEVDKLRSMVISVEWKSQTEHINMLALSAGVVVDFLHLNYKPVIVVDTFSGDKVVNFVADLLRLDSEIGIRSFALITDSGELMRRIRERPEDQFKDISICLEQNADITKHLQPFEQIVDNTKLTPEETATRILETLSGKPAPPDTRPNDDSLL